MNLPSASPGGLGNLGQSARTNHMRQARWILIVVGVLTVLANGAQFAMAPKLVDHAWENEIRKGNIGAVDPVAMEQAKAVAVTAVRIMCSAFLLVGSVFIVFGIIVMRYPVPVTITALAIYVASAAIMAVIDPTTLVQGIILKIIVVIALVKAVQAALAYQKEHAASLEPATLI